MKYFITACFASLLFSCSNNASEKNTEKKETAGAATNTSTPTATTTPQTKKETAVVSFKVNGAEANTKMGGSNDDGKQIGTLNLENNFLNLNLIGDGPAFPHRGALTISIDGWKAAPATYSMGKTCYAGFSRYTTANGGGEIQYGANNNQYAAEKEKRKLSITFTRVEKIAAQFGEQYLASGIFAATLTLNTGFTNTVSTVDITEGKFENVPVSGYGKKQ